MNRLLIAMLLLAPVLGAQSYTVSSAGITYADLAAPNLLTLTDEDLAYTVAPTGFNFTYFGQAYNEFKVGSNGYLIMGSAGTHATYSVSHAAAPGLFIAPMWADLQPAGGGDTVGWYYDAGSATLTVEWYQVIVDPHQWPAPMYTLAVRMQAVLETATGIIRFRYGQVSGFQTTGATCLTTQCCAISGPSGASQEIVNGYLNGYVSASGQVTAYPEDYEVIFTPSAAAPVITSTAPATAVVGTLYTYDITASGYPAPGFSVSGAPAWLSLAGSTLSGTPASSDVGTTGTITVTATNATGTDDEQFTITVSLAAAPPVITSSAPTTALVGSAYSYTITASGNPAPSFGVSGQPGWLSLAGNTLSGTPGAGDVGTAGPITITATNGSGTDSEVFSITVSTMPAAPVITSTAPVSGQAGALYTYSVIATGNPPPTVSFSGLPAWLIQTGNTISGVPGTADVGVHGPITVSATNASGTDDQVFSITIAAAGGGSSGGGAGGGGGGGCAAGAAGAPMLALVGLLLLRRRRK
jgi:hypothetical protein